MKKFLTFLFCTVMCVSLVACGEGSGGSPSENISDQSDDIVHSEEEIPTEIPNMVGIWRVVNANYNNDDSNFTFVIINEEKIGLFLVFDKESYFNTYWYGSFEYPTTAEKSYSFISTSDPEMMEESIIRENSDTKTFEYKDGILSCEITLFGITSKVELEKVEGDDAESSINDIIGDIEGNSVNEPSNSTLDVESAESNSKNIAEWENSRVEIKSAFLSKDSDGNDAIVVNFTWTNNSDETTSAAWSTMCKAFQNGVEIESSYSVQSQSYDADAYYADVRPGTSVDVQYAFSLSDTTAPVEVEIEDFMNFNETKIAYMEFDLTQLTEQ